VGVLADDVVGPLAGLHVLGVARALRAAQHVRKLRVEDERRSLALDAQLALHIAQEVAKVDVEQMTCTRRRSR
jgi:hypothetical protein